MLKEIFRFFENMNIFERKFQEFGNTTKSCLYVGKTRVFEKLTVLSTDLLFTEISFVFAGKKLKRLNAIIKKCMRMGVLEGFEPLSAGYLTTVPTHKSPILARNGSAA